MTNQPHRFRMFAVVVALAAGVLPGCLASGVYRTARTLNPGEGDLNLTFSATRFSTGEQVVTDAAGKKTTTQADSITIPNIIPEVAYHIGVADNFEVGGRAALGSMLVELDAKYRLIQNGGLHVAVDPSLGYRAIGTIEGPSLTLPVITTWDVTDHLALNLAPYVSYTNLTSTQKSLQSLSGKYMSVGGSVGVQIRGATAHFMPSVDFSQTVQDLSGSSGGTSVSQQFVIFSLTMGWVSGRELKKLDTMDEKLDRIEKKLDAPH